MATLLGDIVHPSGNYTTPDGEEKTRWTKVGALFKTDRGYRVKLDAFPADTSETNGWLQVFEPRDRQKAPPRNQPQKQGFRDKPVEQAAFRDDFDPDEDVPF